MIAATLHDLGGPLRIVYVASHQAERRRIQPEADFAISGFIPLGIQQNDIVSRGSNTCGAWLHGLPWEIADGEHGLGLSEAVANGNAPCLSDFLNDFGIEWLSSADKFLALNAVGAQVFEHH